MRRQYMVGVIWVSCTISASAGFLDGLKTIGQGLSEAAGGIVDGAVNVSTGAVQRVKDETVLDREKSSAVAGEVPADKVILSATPAETKADVSAKKERKNVSPRRKIRMKYLDGTPMPDSVAEIADFIANDLVVVIKKSKDVYESHSDFFNGSSVSLNDTPWEKLAPQIISYHPVIPEIFYRWVSDNGKIQNLVVQNKTGGFHCFHVENDLYNPVNCSFYVWAKGEELDEGCKMILKSLKELTKRLESINAGFGDESKQYISNYKSLHGGLENPMPVFKNINFGNSPVCVFKKLTEKSAINAKMLSGKDLPEFPWSENYCFETATHKLEMAFSRYAEDDVASLVFVRMKFLKGVPTVDALKGKYVKQGFTFQEPKKECVGNKWKDPTHASVQIAEYNNAKIAFLGIMSNGEPSGRDKEALARAKKTMSEIEAKYMEPVFVEYIVGENAGYTIQLVSNGPEVDDMGMVKNSNADQNLIGSVTFWDKASVDAQTLAYKKEKTAAAEARAKAAAEKTQKDQDAALDF